MPLDPWFWVILFGGACLHWCLPRRLRAAFISVLSFGYLVTVDPFSACGLAAWTVAFYFLAPRKDALGSLLVLGVLGYLAYFKYIPPLVVALFPSATGFSPILPLGISYYTFKLIHYAIEVRRGNVEERSFWTFCAYIYLFPIFTAGPIERYDHFVENREERFTREALVTAATRIAHGLVKKFVLAQVVIFDWLMQGQGADWFFSDFPSRDREDAWVLVGCSFLYAYLDFSAYCDMAIGCARLFGLKIQENFDWPLLAPDIATFWKRWHMTLASWCQNYVYMPMIGLTRNPYLGTYLTFVAMGVWHSGSLNYVCWGVYHATGVTVARVFATQARKRKWRVPRAGLFGLWRNALTLTFFAGSVVFSLTDPYGFGSAVKLGLLVIGIEVEP